MKTKIIAAAIAAPFLFAACHDGQAASSSYEQELQARAAKAFSAVAAKGITIEKLDLPSNLEDLPLGIYEFHGVKTSAGRVVDCTVNRIHTHSNENVILSCK